MAGEYDETSPAGKDCQKLVTGSEYVELKGVGHLTMWGARGQHVSAVRPFPGAHER